VKKHLFFSVLVFLYCGIYISTPASGQSKKVDAASVAFYNLENLFDTIPGPNDKEFTPDGPNKWDSKKYYTKLHNMAEVISQIGDDYIKGGPTLIGVSEIENRSVLEDLVRTPPLDKTGYQIVQYESPDRRGIDVGFLYQPKRFKVIDSKPFPLKIDSKPNWTTRDILMVEGLLDGDTVFVLVNHWPSRSGGEKETAPLRNAAADLCYSIVQVIENDHPNAKIVIMGDLNDDPVDESLMKHLKVKTKIQNVTPGDLFDPMWQMFKDGNGTLAYRDNWNLFDQIIISSGLTEKTKPGYHYYKALIFKKNFMITEEGRYKGYPFRTFGDGVFQAGYSDHFPVYILLVKEKNN
jgi:hypothetical protein